MRKFGGVMAMCRREGCIRVARRVVGTVGLLLLSATIFLACGDDRADSTVPTAVACDDVTALFAVEAVLDGSGGSCREWVDISLGRAVRGSTGSASIWSGRSEHGTALVVGAVHTLGQGWFGPADTTVVESIVNPENQTGVARLFLMRKDGSGPDALASPWFGLYNPTIAAERNNNFMQNLLPREDFYIAVTDSQKLDVSGLPLLVEPIIREEVPLYAPAATTTTVPTWADAAGSDLLLLLGYPNETGVLTASVGRVLSHDEATQAVATLADLGDEEGNIPYDAEVEMIIQGSSMVGMSGGPAVDEDGRLVGILVRATDVHDGVQYVRVVRMSYIVSRLAAVLEGIDSQTRQAIQRYLEPE